MTEEENLLHLLECADQHLERDGYSVECGSKRWAIREAIKRLEPAPVVPGSKQVRIAVAINASGGVYACNNAGHEMMPDFNDPWITNQCTLVGDVPPVQIPEVKATVEVKS